MVKTKAGFTDRRGRHGKGKRRALRTPISKPKKEVCKGCFADETKFVLVDNGANLVCTDCGLVNSTCRMVEDTVYNRISESHNVRSSPPYRRNNYYAEKMGQFLGKGPPVPDSETDLVFAIVCEMQKEYPSRWADENLTKDHFASIFRSLKRVVPRSVMNYGTMLERWNQFRIGICRATTTPHVTLVNHMKSMFIAIADTFRSRKHAIRGGSRGNMPNYDIISILLLYNIDVKAVIRWGWYFLYKELVLGAASAVKSYKRVESLFYDTNVRMTSYDLKTSEVPDHIIDTWRRGGFRLKVPPMEEVMDLIYQDTQKHGLKMRNKCMGIFIDYK